MSALRGRRIVHVAHGFPPEVIGGTELYVERLALAQRDAGADVRVFAGSLEWKPQVTGEDGVHAGLPVRRVHRADLYFDRWDKGYCPEVSRLFRAFLAETRPDVVHVHHWIRLSTDLVAIAAGLGIPAIVTLHDLYPSCPRVFRLRGADGDEACEAPVARADCVPCVPRWRFDRDDEVARRLSTYRDDMRSELALARARIAPSAGHGQFLAKMLELDVTAHPIEDVPHGRLAPKFDSSPSASRDGKLRLACFSHLQPLKGQHVLLDAVARCAARDRIEVDLFGAAVDPPYEDRLRAMSAGLVVRQHGRYERAELSKATIDVAVLPTLCRESWSFILDEAGDLGVPILAARAGALEERATGRMLLFERNDPADLAAKIDQLAADPTRLATMRAAPPPAFGEFAEHADRITALYARAIAAGAPAMTSGPTSATAEARLIEEWRRREAYFQELVRIEKWEDVVAELRARIAILERQLRG